MRIYENGYELMSEMGRDLHEMGIEVGTQSYQNVKAGDKPFLTKELMMKSYCLTGLPDPDSLFAYTHCRTWADAEFNERIYEEVDLQLGTINPGYAWVERKEVWERFLNNEGKFDYTYNERFQHPVASPDDTYDIPALLRVIIELKDNSGTRQAILPIFHPRDLDNMRGRKRIPCSMYYMLMIRKNNKGEDVLHLNYHQRSSDFVTHFGNDCYLAWRMKDYIAGVVGVKPGYLYHVVDSLHVYENDWHLIKDTLQKHI